MIDGISVIDTVQIRNTSLSAMIVLTLVMIIILLLSSILLYFCVKGRGILQTVVCGLLIIGTVTLTCNIWTDWATNGRQYHTEYKVILEDDLRYNDFVERYEILNQDGRIYTIKERN